MKKKLNKTFDAVVSPGMLNETKELNIRERQKRKISLQDRFFEKTSTLGTAATKVPVFLVKEFSLARINSYFNLLIFGGGAVWAFLKIKDNLNNFFQIIFPIMIAVLSVYKIFQAIMNLSHVYNDSKKIKNDKNNDYQSVPMFIIQVYRALLVKRIDINWFGLLYYLFGGIYLIIPQLLKGKTIPYTIITFKFTNINDLWGVYNIVKYSIIALLIFHALYLLWTKQRIGVINRFYGYEIVPNIEQLEIKKARHAKWRRGIVVTILVICVVPIIISRLLRNRGYIK